MKEKIDQILLLLSLLIGVITAVTKTQDFLLSIYWAPEILLIFCILILMTLASRLILAKKRISSFPSNSIEPLYSRNVRYAGTLLLITAPLAGLIIWFTALRVSPETQKQIADLETAGDISVKTGQPRKALEFYKQALDKDTRRTDIRAKYEKAEVQITGGK